MTTEEIKAELNEKSYWDLGGRTFAEQDILEAIDKAHEAGKAENQEVFERIWGVLDDSGLSHLEKVNEVWEILYPIMAVIPEKERVSHELPLR